MEAPEQINLAEMPLKGEKTIAFLRRNSYTTLYRRFFAAFGGGRVLKARIYKFFNKIINRVTITVLLCVIQLIWLASLFFRLTSYAVWIDLALTVLSFVIALRLLRKDENPAYTIAWIAVIGLFPLLGGMLYLFLGDKRPSYKLRTRIEQTERRHRAELMQQKGPVEKLSARMGGLSRYIAAYGPYPAWEHSRATYFASGEEAFPHILADLESAEHFIFLEYFIIKPGAMWDAIVDILKRKAAAGVEVRLIYDDVGCIGLPGDFIVQMERSHIHCIPFNPVVPLLSAVMNHRDHRKILVVDGNVAYNGGINLADEYINREQRFGYWKDTALRIEGEAVWNCTVMFLNFWNAFRPSEESYDAFRPGQFGAKPTPSDGVIQPYADTPLDEERLAENVYLDILEQARDYVYIFTPYLAIGHEMLTALQLAAKRGVDVRIVTPGIPDKKLVYRLTRSYYAPLLKAGVRVYEYTPGFLHAKSYVSDGRIATVGSINMDYRSLYLHFECGTLLMHNSQIAAIKKDALATIRQSREVTLKDCRHSLPGDLLDDVLRLISPLL
jgi:cardiolipin synthase